MEHNATKSIRAAILLVCACLLWACNFPAQDAATINPSTPQPTAAATESPRQSDTPKIGASPHIPERAEEAIVILEPGSGSRLRSPMRVSGAADPTFEQTLVVRLVDMTGTELALQPVTIAAESGSRGAFEGTLPFSVSSEQRAVIQVYAESARDGGITHLASVPVLLANAGEENVLPGEAQPEQIAIFEPTPGEEIGGEVLHVEGFGLASFEQTLVIEIYAAEGTIIGSRAVIVQAPDLGFPGTFQADVPFAPTAAGPGRVVVRDISPAFGGDVHVSSVEIRFAP